MESNVGKSSFMARLKVVKNEGIAEVVLNRPKEYNVMDDKFFTEVGEVFRALDEDEEVNVVILWAEGKVFTAGLDLKVAASQFTGVFVCFFQSMKEGVFVRLLTW